MAKISVGLAPPKLFRAPFDLGPFPERTEAFLPAVATLPRGCFLAARAVFPADFVLLASVVFAFARPVFFAGAFDFVGFFEAFFFLELAIFSVAPLVVPARGEA
ncbi:MAG TPA: hypothetical protein VGI42_07255 [Chthoniobacterales bacterium]